MRHQNARPLTALLAIISLVLILGLALTIATGFEESNPAAAAAEAE